MTQRPLAGFTIGVTADRRSDEQIKLLQGRGAECLHGPVIKTHPLDSSERLAAATQSLLDDPPALAVFATGIGVRGWFESADSLQLGDQLRELLSGIELYARGQKANGALATAGFDPTASSPLPRYVEVIDALAERGVAGLRVAVQVDGAGAPELCSAIEALGATVVAVPVYRWSLPDDASAAERLVRSAVERRIDAVTFTTRPAVDNFLHIAEVIGVRDELIDVIAGGDIVASCVGPVCAAGFTDLGLAPPLVPERYRLGAMVHQLAGYFGAMAKEFELAGTRLRVQGRLVLIDGCEDTWLSDRERAILDVLIERPGVVYSKGKLLRRVWHGAERDEHLVEVTVARLRQRLGPAGAGIETVMRRGYRVSAT